MKKRRKTLDLYNILRKKKLNIYELRWECMRQSKEYKEDYNCYRKTCAKLYNNKDFDELEKYEKKQILFFAEKYQITNPLDPSTSIWFPEKLIYTPGASLITHLWNIRRHIMPAVCVSSLIKGVVCIDSDRYIDGGLDGWSSRPLTDEALKKKEAITIVVDLNAPLYRVRQEVVNIVSKWQKLRSKVTPIPRMVTKPKLTECQKHLEIYILKKEGWTPDMLARRFCKGSYKTNPDVARNIVWRHYYKASELIDKGGYKQIR